MIKKTSLTDVKQYVLRASKTSKELSNLNDEFERNTNPSERKMIDSQIKSLSGALKKNNNELRGALKNFNITKKLSDVKTMQNLKVRQPSKIPSLPVKGTLKPLAAKIAKPVPKMLDKKVKFELSDLEKETIKRLKKKEKKVVKEKERKPSAYVRISNKLFSGISGKLLDKEYFRNMKRNLMRSNMPYLTKSYISMMFFSLIVSFFVACFVVGFFMFFSLGATFPFISSVTRGFATRFLMLFWLLLVIPIGTFTVMYFYPSLEKKSIEGKINQELPFATIHMAAISESSIEPSNIFEIIVSTGEYKTLQKEFIKLLNEINVFGYDLVTALRNIAFNSPSKKLTELFDGLATTITTGGDLSDFFDKRAQSLLFDYRLEREKQTKSAETFMDIYISVVIAAPMILMLLLIMMRISGLGISLSAGMISLVMVLGVSIINVVFLTFLQLKQQNQ